MDSKNADVDDDGNSEEEEDDEKESETEEELKKGMKLHSNKSVWHILMKWKRNCWKAIGKIGWQNEKWF